MSEVKLAPRTAEQAAAFLKEQHEGPLAWKQLCLKLQRVARGLPIVYPSALTAALATPKSERVLKIEDLRPGMVAYSDDPADDNPFAHIYFIAGRSRTTKEVLTWTNDALRSGGVDIVPISWYKRNWGDNFMFGATWLNGYDFSEFDKPPVESRGSLGENYAHAVEDVAKALRYHKKRGHLRIAEKLQKDLDRMNRRLEAFSN